MNLLTRYYRWRVRRHYKKEVLYMRFMEIVRKYPDWCETEWRDWRDALELSQACAKMVNLLPSDAQKRLLEEYEAKHGKVV